MGIKQILKVLARPFVTRSQCTYEYRDNQGKIIEWRGDMGDTPAALRKIMDDHMREADAAFKDARKYFRDMWKGR